MRWGWPREAFVHVPNFVDVERFRPGNAVGRRFVYCGRLESEGRRNALRAAALAKHRHLRRPRTGRGAPAQIRRRTARGRVFSGHLAKEALVGVLQSARAIVVPSECNENAPLSLLEAYATARPVIGANIAGIPELIREDETGALFPTGNVHALADTLERFARLPDTRLAEMGNAGRRWVEQDFNPAIYRDRLLELYASLKDAPHEHESPLPTGTGPLPATSA